MPTTPPAARRSPLNILDLVVGIVLTLVTGLIGLIMMQLMSQLGQLSAECAGIAADGTRCSTDFLTGIGILGTAIVVFGWFLPLGFLVVRAVRRRIVFFLPLIGFVVMIAGYYLVLALISANYLPSSST
jgi:hypothetical protein